MRKEKIIPTSKIIILILLLGFFGIIKISQAADYYVDNLLPASCESGNYSISNRSCTGTDGVAWKTLHEANINLVAGDVAYIRGGTYEVGDYNGGTETRGIAPEQSGAAGNPITYSVYPGDNPVLFQDNRDTKSYPNRKWSFGIRIFAHDHIRVTGCPVGMTCPNGTYGMKFTGMSNFLYIYGNSLHSDFNDVGYCEFSDSEADTYYAYGYVSKTARYNRVHHNKFHHAGWDRIDTSNWGDMFTIGVEADALGLDRYNVFEWNESYATGHSTLSIFGKYNIVRNNYFHHEEWFPGYWKNVWSEWVSMGNYSNITGSFSTAGLPEWILGSGWADGSGMAVKNADGLGTLSLSSPVPAVAGQPYIVNMSANLQAGSMIVSYGGQSRVLGIGTNNISFHLVATNSDSLVFSPNTADTRLTLDNVELLLYYDDPAASDIDNCTEESCSFGYRNLITNGMPDASGYHIIENNRLGYAGERVNEIHEPLNVGYNWGGTGIKLSTPHTILRYNAFFGNKGTSITLTSQGSMWTSSQHSRIYNNSFYHNGYHSLPVGNTSPVNVNCVSSYSEGVYSNETCWSNANTGVHDIVLKNNLFFANDSYVNHNQPSIVAGYAGCTACDYWNAVYNPEINVHNWDDYITRENPLFADTTLTDTTSWLLPDLTPSFSGIVDQGTFLTSATNSGSSSTILTVVDALYFQDRSFGSTEIQWPDNIAMEADWICIGSIGQCVQISAVDYESNIITLSSVASWSANASVWLYKQSDGSQVFYGDEPDYGAYEDLSEDPDLVAPLPPVNLAVN